MKITKALSLLLVFFLNSCQKKNPEDFNSDPTRYTEYVSSFSSGFVPAKSDFRVELTSNVGNWKPNQELDSDLFDISPSVKGKVFALSANTIAFIPSEKLEQNTMYYVSLDLAKIYSKIPNELQAFNFTVKTFKQDFLVETKDLQSYSENYYYLNGNLKSADELSLVEAQKIIFANYKDKKLKIKIDKSASSPTNYKFIVDSIPRTNQPEILALNWNGDAIDQDVEGKLEYKIPAKGEFKVLNIAIPDANNQTVTINFSEPLKRDQDFKGLVSVENTTNLKYATMGNVLKVFFDNTNNTISKVSNKIATVSENTTVLTDSVASYYDISAEENYNNQNTILNAVADAFSGTKLIEVFEGIQSLYNNRLEKNYAEKLTFDAIKPGIKLVKSGTILPSSNNLKLNFEVANLNAVDVKVYKIYKNNILQFLQNNQLSGTENLRQVSQAIAKTTIQLKQNNLIDYTKWNVYALDISKLIEPEPGAIYRVEFSFKKKYSLYNCSGKADKEEYPTETEEELAENDINYSNNDYNYYYENDYEWRATQNPCDSYYYYNTNLGTNILASDLGVIAKRGLDKSLLIAVSDIVTTKPIAGATVELYNYQQQKIASSITDSSGLTEFELDKYAYFAIVKQGKSTTYLKLDDELSLSISNFDVSGETLQKGLKGFMYGERGVYRPGDSIYTAFILNDNANPLPANHPIKFRLTNPSGKVYFENVKQKSDLNHYVFKVATTQDAPTGNWEAMISVGGARFYKSVKIETIKPNRLKIKNSFNASLLSANQNNTNTIQALWLHGAIAKNLKAEVQAKFTQQITAFNGYSNYIFDDPTRKFSTEEITLFSGKLNENGQANVSINPNIQSKSPGLLKAAFITKVYENGGDFSTDVATTTYSPYTTYVGLQTPKPNRYGLLETDKNYTFPIATVNAYGKPAATSNLEVKVYRLESRWWWDSSNDNLSNYSSTTYTSAYKSFKVSTNSSGKANVTFSVKDVDWGNYLVRVIDTKSGHATGTTLYFDSPYWSSKAEADGQSAVTLRFTTDKTKYQVGENAQIFFPSSQGGRALISVENGTKVLKSIWANTKDGETQVSIPITEEMAPNVYFNITLLQPHANTVNDSPIRMYGVVPIEVVNKNTILQPQIIMPETVRPETSVNVKVSEKTGKSMTYTIAVVEDGLLDLTRFKTPNAWDSFYAKEALGVRTWDVYNDVIGAYGGKINQVFSIGGDADAGGATAKKANRFKPVVLYYGPFELKSGEQKNHNLKIPKYIGSVRTMVVAANAKENAYGMAEKTTSVKSPLMVLASLPRKISPSEKVTIPVTIFATDKNIKNVSIQIKTNSKIKILGSANQTVNFSSPDEKMAYFNLAVGNATGIGTIDVIATSGKEKSVYSVEIDVTNPNPETTLFEDAIIGGNASKTIHWNTFGVAGSNSSKIEISSIPTVDFGRRLRYLIQYPHGCVEQTTSSAFPQLFLADVVDVDKSTKESIQRNVTATINKLGNFQLSNGGLSYWPGNNEADDWGTSYAGHFMVEAEKKGYVLPISFKAKWISYQSKSAKQWRFEKRYQNDLAQAYRLYTLALVGSPDVSSMNRLRETNGISNESKLRLAAAYALIKQKSAGLSLLSKSQIDESYNDNYYYYYGSEDRNRAMTLETLLLLGQKEKAFRIAKDLAKNLSSNQWMSTQTTAFGLYAMAQFAKSNGSTGISVQYTVNGKSVSVTSNKAIAQRNLIIQNGKNGVTIKNNKNNTLFVRVLNTGILPVGEEQVVQKDVRVSVQFVDRNGAKASVSKIAQGTEFIASVVITNLRNERMENIALTQILPSGFEIVNTRFTDYGDATNNNANYIDIRDDRSNYYFDLSANETRRFKIVVNASYLGSYYFPGIQCEAMYDNGFMARTKGQWVEIVR
jgi:hypothetical protein